MLAQPTTHSPFDHYIPPCVILFLRTYPDEDSGSSSPGNRQVRPIQFPVLSSIAPVSIVVVECLIVLCLDL